MRPHGGLRNDPEANAAAWEAARGAVIGACKWGAFGGVLAGVGYAMSPIYRNLTFQFKVYLQMSVMTIGSMIEADNHLRDYEQIVRRRKRLQRDTKVWQRYEEEYARQLDAKTTAKKDEE